MTEQKNKIKITLDSNDLVDTMDEDDDEQDGLIHSLDDDKEDMLTFITFICKDDKRIKIKKDIAIQSNLVKVTLETDSDMTEIKLQDYDINTMTKIERFVCHYDKNPMMKIPQPLTSIDLKNYISVWYVTFISMQHQQLFELLKLSNYLHIQPLINLGCAKMATIIKDKTPNEIHNIFNIPTE